MAKNFNESGKNSLIFFGIIGIAIVLIAGFFLFSKPADSAFSGQTLELYRAQSCGCCGEYDAYLRANGVNVNSSITNAVDSIKGNLGIPQSMRSCHTSKIGKYFLEGHIPMEAIEKLLKEQPDIDGLALPGMKPGSPGMSGAKTESFIIYAIKDGKITEYAKT